MERGFLRSRGGYLDVDLGKEFSFIRPGKPTSWNPIEAVRQGLAGESSDERIPVTAWRCPRCGLLELHASKEDDDPTAGT